MVDAVGSDPSRLRSVSGTAAPDSLGFFHPSRRPYRFTILTFISLIVMEAILPTTALEPSRPRSLRLCIWTAATSAISIRPTPLPPSPSFSSGHALRQARPRRSSLLFCLLVLVGATIVALAQSRWQLFAGG